MHGVIRSTEFDEQKELSSFAKVRKALYPLRWFGLLVILPTLIAAAYYYLVASNQYETTADFVVRRSDANGRGGIGLGQVLGFSLDTSQSQAEAAIVAQYLQSPNAVRVLREKDRLIERFTRPGIDWLSRLGSDSPTPERLLKYYGKRVIVSEDTDTGIMHLSVRAFTPQDSYDITRRLLQLGEQRVNQMNQRSYSDQVSTSRKNLAEAEATLKQALQDLTGFRRVRADVDPATTARVQIGLVSGVSAQLAATRAKMANVGSVVSRNSPQYRALVSQVSALESQVAAENQRLAGAGTSIATGLGDYEDLMVRKEFATQRFAAAAVAHEQAKLEIAKQQLYVTRVVDPEMPVKPLFPERGKSVAIIFFSLLAGYAIGWLLITGVKEHSI